jgi:hypothetical protein
MCGKSHFILERIYKTGIVSLCLFFCASNEDYLLKCLLLYFSILMNQQPVKKILKGCISYVLFTNRTKL